MTYLVEVKNFEPELTFKSLDDARFFTAVTEELSSLRYETEAVPKRGTILTNN